MNLSETVFVSKGWNKKEGKFSETNRYTIRWFTPDVEEKLCGHGTLASAHILLERMGKEENDAQSKKDIIFESKYKGILGASKYPKSELITLDFPKDVPKLLNRDEYPWIDDLIEATLGSAVSKDEVQEVLRAEGIKDIIIRLKDNDIKGEERIRKICPNFVAMTSVSGIVFEMRAVIVTEKANYDKEKVHFYSRFFAPWDGGDEDPVTGSAHTTLAPYWKQQYGNNIDILYGKQCSKRSGLICCSVNDDRVQMSGQTRTCIKGELFV